MLHPGAVCIWGGGGLYPGSVCIRVGGPLPPGVLWDTVNEWAVRILLEYILVLNIYVHHSHYVGANPVGAGWIPFSPKVDPL